MEPVPSFEPEKLTPEHLSWLASRGISQATADKAGLFSARKWFSQLGREENAIGFPYFRDGKFVSAKYRSLDGKAFTQERGGAQDLFLLDEISTDKPVVLVEGEMDALAAIEAGIDNVCSVPGGAPLKVADGKVSPSEDRKFAFLWRAFEKLSKAPHVVLATDNDEPGKALAEELARRIGKHRCRLVRFEEKDFNDLLLHKGGQVVREVVEKAECYPVAGLSDVSKYASRLDDLWGKGTGKGASTGFPCLDQIYTVAPGQLTVVTGYPSSGKSNFVDQLMVNLASMQDWKFAVCSFENQPEVHISRLMEIKTKKRFFEGRNRMTQEERDDALAWVADHFLFLDSETVEPATIDSILERATAAVARMGCRGLVIDPYNYIDLRSRDSETAAISDLLTRVQAFAKSAGVHVWFVAHPAKITRSGVSLPRPDGMAISGSMAWWAKADCGLTVHRAETGVEIAVWKCRYRWVGCQGETILGYESDSGTYSEVIDGF